MANAIGRAHMRYARWYNRQHGWSGHLWANRFFSTVLDPEHLWHAVRYVEANPVRARMVTRAADYEWSSCPAHSGLTTPHSILASARPFPGHIGTSKWSDWIDTALPTPVEGALRVNTSTGRPTGSQGFVMNLEELLERQLHRQKAGRKPKTPAPDATPDLFENLNA